MSYKDKQDEKYKYLVDWNENQRKTIRTREPYNGLYSRNQIDLQRNEQHYKLGQYDWNKNACKSKFYNN